MASSKQILLIEDEERIARVMALELEYEGYTPTIAMTGRQGLAQYQQRAWDVIVLDLMLPELNGMEVLREIRASDEITPIILLTARDSVVDKIHGLDQGANDYLTKPFQMEELLARIRACLRMRQIFTKSEEEADTRLQVGDLTLNESTREVQRAGVSIDLTPREFDLLVFFLRHQNQVLDREQILTQVWGYDYFGSTNVVDVYVRYLRRKIDYPFSTYLIHTIRGVGYTLKESSDAT